MTGEGRNDGLLLDQGLGGTGGDGGEQTREQVDPRQVRLSGELQRRVYQRTTAHCGLRTSSAQVT